MFETRLKLLILKENIGVNAIQYFKFFLGINEYLLKKQAFFFFVDCYVKGAIHVEVQDKYMLNSLSHKT